MIEGVIIALRLAQYAGAAVLFGFGAFCLYAPTGDASHAFARRARLTMGAAAAVLAAASLAAIAAQSVFFAGSAQAGMSGESLSAVAFQMGMGKAALVRSAATLAALGLLFVLRPSRAAAFLTTTLGAIAAASLAWTGHAGAGEGTAGRVLLASDIVHLLAAAAWIGALVGFVELLFARPTTEEACNSLHRALHRFAGVGSVLVATLVLTGAVNAWIIVGPQGIPTLPGSTYGRLLLLKLALFAAMLALAAANRFRLTPALAGSLEHVDTLPASLQALRRSLVLETAAGTLVLVLVAWFGTLAPPGA